MSRDITTDFSIFDQDHPNSVFEAYARLRRDRPVAYTDDYNGYWALTRYQDVKDAASNADLFISSVKAVVPSDPRGIRRPPLNFDAPRHTPYRRALVRSISPSRVEEIISVLRPKANDLFLDFITGTDTDIASTFGTRLPAWAASLWLNLEEDRAEWLADTATQWVDAWRQQDAEQVTQHSEEMYDVARWLVEDRKINPQDPRTDPASSLLSERPEGQPLETEFIVGAIRQSLVVGMVAPPLLIGSMAYHLAKHPSIHADLSNGDIDLHQAAEEYIRLFTPYRGFARTVSTNTSVHGVRIEPQEPVTLVYAAANRDPSVFEEPDEFRPGRHNIGQHLGFGKGRHQCVGMHLARGIVRTALETMVANSSRFELLQAPVPTRMPELGYQTVHVSTVPRRPVYA